MKTYFPFFLLILLVIMSCEPIAETWDYDDWDKDLDEALDSSEFRAYVEFTEYFYEIDEDDNGTLNPDELSSHINDHYENYDPKTSGNFNDWDLNKDGSLSEKEFIEGTYKAWDQNNSGKVEKDEFSNYSFDVLE